MALDKTLKNNISRDVLISIFLYALPVVAVYLYFVSKGERPWINNAHAPLTFNAPSFFHFIQPIFKNLQTWGFSVLILIIGIVEFAFGLYENKWSKSERTIDIICFIAPIVLLTPLIVLFSLKLLPWALPHLANEFSWVPFWGGVFIIAVADDLTQYWYHRLHHQ